jgi:hypothetical protein
MRARDIVERGRVIERDVSLTFRKLTSIFVLLMFSNILRLCVCVPVCLYPVYDCSLFMVWEIGGGLLY